MIPETDPRSARPEDAPRPYRVALYGHDSYGLGHLRRNLLLARSLLRARDDTEVLLLTGSPRAHSFEADPRLLIERLPAVTKDERGRYVTENPQIPLAATVRQRKRVVRDTIRRFNPDLFVVDHTPAGLKGELLPLLVDLRNEGRTEIVVGLRDILDEPSRVIEDWRLNGIYRLLHAVYHRVWVYGSRDVFPLEELYAMPPELAHKLVYLGYLGRKPREAATEHPSLSSLFPDPDRPHALCVVGGGGDGYPLAHCFLRMLEEQPERFNGTLVTGPFLPRRQRQLLDAAGSILPHAQVLRFTGSMEDLITGSDVVVSMGGYNSMIETLSFGTPTLVVPRVFPRREQWLRARAFTRRGVVRMLEPSDLNPSAMAGELEHLLGNGSSHVQDLPQDGVGQFVHHIGQALASRMDPGVVRPALPA